MTNLLLIVSLTLDIIVTIALIIRMYKNGVAALISYSNICEKISAISDNIVSLNEKVNNLNKICYENIDAINSKIDVIHKNVIRSIDENKDRVINTTGQLTQKMNELYNMNVAHIDDKFADIDNKIHNHYEITDKNINKFDDDVARIERRLHGLALSIDYIKEFVSAKKNHRKVKKDEVPTCGTNCKKD